MTLYLTNVVNAIRAFFSFHLFSFYIRDFITFYMHDKRLLARRPPHAIPSDKIAKYILVDIL